MSWAYFIEVAIAAKSRLMKYAMFLGCWLSITAAAQAASKDVNNVLFRGDSTLMGMNIKAVYSTDGAFLIQTTGARYEYVPGELRIYQGLDPNQRLLATVSFDGTDKFEKIENTSDHTLFWSERFNVGIYGDSTCIIVPKTTLIMSYKGNFKPDYEGRYKGELLLIDGLGGMEIYPQRYEAGYDINTIQLGRKDWIANYKFKAGERVMLAAFPGKAFDFARYLRSNVLSTNGSTGLGGNAYGQLAPNDVIVKWAKNFQIITIFFNGFYVDSYTAWGAENPCGPYYVANKPEFRRFMNTAHRNNMKVATYSSLYYWLVKSSDVEAFFNQIAALKSEFGTDGVYVDGFAFDGDGRKIENKIGNWELTRRFRSLFGSEGVIIYHGTNLGSPTAPVPNLESYCDGVVVGENIAFKAFDDPYIQYQVKKFGISNTVSLWKPGPHPSNITDQDIYDFELFINGLDRWGGFIDNDSPPPYNSYKWQSDIIGSYPYYLKKLALKAKEKSQ